MQDLGDSGQDFADFGQGVCDFGSDVADFGQQVLDLPQSSKTFFSLGMSNSTKGLDKSKEENSVQACKGSNLLIF